MNYRLSQKAEQDLLDIRKYTIKNYGKKQAKNYLKKIKEKLEFISNNPEAGILREETVINYSSINVEKHVIFYKKTKGFIAIARILHQKMDVKTYI